MSILSPTDRAILWRTAVTSARAERPSLLKVLAAEILASAGRRLGLYGPYEQQVIETVETLDKSGLLGRDDLREAFEEADEDDERAQAFVALLISHLGAASDMERLEIDVRLKALRLAGAWQQHIDDRAQAEPEWVTASQVAARYGVTPQAVYKWIAAGRVDADQTPGGSWRLPAAQFSRRERRPRAAARLKSELLERAGEAPGPSDDELAGEVVKRRRS